MLIKIYFLGFIDSKQARLSIVKDILGKVSEAAQEISSLKESLDESLSEEDKIFAKYPLKTLDYGVMSHEAAKNWVNEIYETIKKTLEIRSLASFLFPFKLISSLSIRNHHHRLVYLQAVSGVALIHLYLNRPPKAFKSLK